MLFFDFFYEMLTKHYIIPVSTEQNKSLAAVKEVLDHISLHYQENLTASELSGLSNYSEYYFMKLFRQYTGKTLVEYINDFRMEKAKYLLTHSDAPVTEIAMNVGFNSTSYFIKKFQQANEVSAVSLTNILYIMTGLLYFCIASHDILISSKTKQTTL